MTDFGWNPRAGQYVRPNGQFVPRAEVRRAIDTSIRAEEAVARSLADDLRTGRITLETWRTEMREMIKAVHVYSAAAAKGGWAQMTPADYGRVGQIVRGEYGFLEAFARKIATGKMPLDGRIQGYALQYALAGRDTYHMTERATMTAAGFRFELNVLHPADHCEMCLDETARGRVPIGSLIPIGRRTCRRFCKCSLSYFKEES